jgi:hypothetical protein
VVLHPLHLREDMRKSKPIAVRLNNNGHNTVKRDSWSSIQIDIAMSEIYGVDTYSKAELPGLSAPARFCIPRLLSSWVTLGIL